MLSHNREIWMILLFNVSFSLTSYADCLRQPKMSMMLKKITISLIFLLSISMNTDAQFEDYCIADEQTPDDVLMAAMKWACENGADCGPIQENQPCYLPNTTMDHASYAFNSYYQNMKHKGGSCYFNSAALLSALNPSHGACKFESLP